MELRLRAVENDAFKPKQKKFFKFKFNCNPLTGSQNIVITSDFSYTYMTLWPQNLISSSASARYIHDQSLAGIHQLVLEITRSRAVFAYIMSHTFDLWTPKFVFEQQNCWLWSIPPFPQLCLFWYNWRPLKHFQQIPKFGRNPLIGSSMHHENGTWLQDNTKKLTYQM